jgi:hypothetical protein
MGFGTRKAIKCGETEDQTHFCVPELATRVPFEFATLTPFLQNEIKVLEIASAQVRSGASYDTVVEELKITDQLSKDWLKNFCDKHKQKLVWYDSIVKNDSLVASSVEAQGYDLDQPVGFDNDELVHAVIRACRSLEPELLNRYRYYQAVFHPCIKEQRERLKAIKETAEPMSFKVICEVLAEYQNKRIITVSIPHAYRREEDRGPIRGSKAFDRRAYSAYSSATKDSGYCHDDVEGEIRKLKPASYKESFVPKNVRFGEPEHFAFPEERFNDGIRLVAADHACQLQQLFSPPTGVGNWFGAAAHQWGWVKKSKSHKSIEEVREDLFIPSGDIEKIQGFVAEEAIYGISHPPDFGGMGEVVVDGNAATDESEIFAEYGLDKTSAFLGVELNCMGLIAEVIKLVGTKEKTDVVELGAGLGNFADKLEFLGVPVTRIDPVIKGKRNIMVSAMAAADLPELQGKGKVVIAVDAGPFLISYLSALINRGSPAEMVIVGSNNGMDSSIADLPGMSWRQRHNWKGAAMEMFTGEYQHELTLSAYPRRNPRNPGVINIYKHKMSVELPSFITQGRRVTPGGSKMTLGSPDLVSHLGHFAQTPGMILSERNQLAGTKSEMNELWRHSEEPGRCGEFRFTAKANKYRGEQGSSHCVVHQCENETKILAAQCGCKMKICPECWKERYSKSPCPTCVGLGKRMRDVRRYKDLDGDSLYCAESIVEGEQNEGEGATLVAKGGKSNRVMSRRAARKIKRAARKDKRALLPKEVQETLEALRREPCAGGDCEGGPCCNGNPEFDESMEGISEWIKENLARDEGVAFH